MIFGDRIRLRLPEHSDLPTFVAWLNDPGVRQAKYREGQYISVSLMSVLGSE